MDIPKDTTFFVGWGTLSLINVGLAQAKGRDGGAWWFASILLGPVATFLIVTLPPVPPTVGPRGNPGREA